MLRLCLATDSLDPSGVGNHLIDLASGARDAGHDVLVVAHAATPLLAAASARGLRVAALTPDGAEIGRQELDLVHVHAGIGWEGHGAVRAAAAAGLPVVRTEHLPWLLTDADQVAEYHASLPLVRRVVAVGHGVAETHRAAGVPDTLLTVIPNGVDGDVPHRPRAQTRASLGQGEGPLLLHVGRFTPQKRHDLVLAAFARLAAVEPEARLLLVGTGAGQAEARELVEAAGLGDRVAFLGRRDDVGDLLAAADLLLLPSDFEGLPLVLLEAMAAGTPVVATDVCGIAELVDESVGRLVPPDDAGALADAVVAALADPVETARRAEAARARHASHHTRAAMVAATLDLYHDVLAQEQA